jgi:hypothetical protein
MLLFKVKFVFLASLVLNKIYKCVKTGKMLQFFLTMLADKHAHARTHTHIYILYRKREREKEIYDAAREN